MPLHAETVIYAYSEYEHGDSLIYCQNEPLVGNFGIRQSLYQKKYFTITARYNHLSCIFERKDQEYNALGIGFEYILFK